MIAGVLGIAAFVLALFVAGALMESDILKAVKFGLALAVCLVAILAGTDPRPFAHNVNCSVEWDGRANSTVCD